MFSPSYRVKVYGNIIGNNKEYYTDCGLPRPNNNEGRCVGCVSCGVSGECPTLNSEPILITTNKRIYNASRVPASQYMGSLAAANVFAGSSNKTPQFPSGRQFQMSDRARGAVGRRVVPSHGNSLRGSITRARPGASAPGGTGVDVKHDSYARYLARKKGNYERRGESKYDEVKNLRPRAVVNNKVQKPSLLGWGLQADTCCRPNV
jgi:hypothetical protein